jgi:hypothetical protein
MTGFGPWRDDMPEEERRAEFRAWSGLAFAYVGPRAPLTRALAAAEHDKQQRALALRLLDEIPALPRRRLLAAVMAWRALRQRSNVETVSLS